LSSTTAPARASPPSAPSALSSYVTHIDRARILAEIRARADREQNNLIIGVTKGYKYK
jgi:hypothetical protein